jgi:hypothetical protein
MKTKIPLWINILQGIIFAILAFQTYACYFNPQAFYPDVATDSATRQALYVLGGRNALMAVISLLALVKQNPRFYSFAFIMHSLRELQDMFILPLTGEPGTGAIINFFVFLIVFVIPEVTAYIKLNRMANELEKG